MPKNDEFTYRSCNVNYRVYCDGDRCGGTATILFDYASHIETTQITLTKNVDNIEEAEKLIIENSKRFIDSKLA